MSLQTYWTFVAPLLLLGAGGLVLLIGWLFTREGDSSHVKRPAE